MKTKGKKVLILGGGLAGLSAAYHLKRDYLLLERGNRCGGLAQTERVTGYSIDLTGHWLYFRDPYTSRWIGDLLGDTLLRTPRRSMCYSHATYTHYPFQANTHGLPEKVAAECLSGFEKALARQITGDRPPENFHDWILYHYGEGFAKHFMIPYNRKMWGMPLDQITSAWTDRFVPVPDARTVQRGARGESRERMGYNPELLYPREGGIEALPRAIAGTLDPDKLRLQEDVVSIDWRRKRVRTASAWHDYDHLLNSIPLHRFASLLHDPPEAVTQAGERLRYTPVEFVSYGIKGQAPLPYHWVYCPEPRFPFYRVGCASNVASSLAPADRYLLYVERAGSVAELLPQIRRGLCEMGWLRDENHIELERITRIPCAYVIFDHHYESARSAILQFLGGQDIDCIGRFGNWTYGGMEDALLDGKKSAERLND